MSVCLSICSVLFYSTLIYTEPHVCQADTEFSLWLMINFSCQLDWIWEDDLSMGLWDYFLEELAKGERPPPEWATPSGSIPICRKGNLSGEAVLVFSRLSSCLWLNPSTPLLRLQLLSSLTVGSIFSSLPLWTEDTYLCKNPSIPQRQIGTAGASSLSDWETTGFSVFPMWRYQLLGYPDCFMWANLITPPCSICSSYWLCFSRDLWLI